MKQIIPFVAFFILIGCSSNSDCFECYLEQHPKESKNAIKDLHSSFENFLELNFPESQNTPERLQAYCTKLIANPDFIENISLKETQGIIEDYNKSGLKEEFRDWGNNTVNPSGLYFSAQRNCLEFDSSDSLVYNYLNAYEVAGDISPVVFVEYIANEKDLTKLANRMLQHQFIAEYFIPRILNKNVAQQQINPS